MAPSLSACGGELEELGGVVPVGVADIADWRALSGFCHSTAPLGSHGYSRMFRSLVGLPLVLATAACSGVPLDAQPPVRYDVGGQWVLNGDLSDPPPNTRQIMARADRDFAEGRIGQPSGGALAFVTQDFPVLEAKSMVIEQDSDSMGIRYDNGVYRDVSWGERKRGLWKVSAGWLEGDLVIVSRASDATGRETFRLSEGGLTLEVVVEANSDGEKLRNTRVFERVPAP